MRLGSATHICDSDLRLGSATRICDLDLRLISATRICQCADFGPIFSHAAASCLPGVRAVRRREPGGGRGMAGPGPGGRLGQPGLGCAGECTKPASSDCIRGPRRRSSNSNSGKFVPANTVATPSRCKPSLSGWPSAGGSPPLAGLPVRDPTRATPPCSESFLILQGGPSTRT